MFLIIGYVIILAASVGTYALHGSLAALWVPAEYVAIFGLMIGGFVRTNLALLTDDDVDALEVLLEIPDVDLADWLTGRRPIPPESETPMLRRIRDSLPQ